MNRTRSLVLAAPVIALLMVTACVGSPPQRARDKVSDEEYITIARTHPDAQAFMEKYPQAETSVDRSGKLAVDFRAKPAPPGEPIRLRVFVDAETNKPTETFIGCNSKMTTSNLKQYLEQYSATLKCP